jgi:bifunctional NMN adenylyltransferase/nudix hydrolase
MENADYDIGIIVGRFQVDSLHSGHRQLMDSVVAAHKRVVIFLGVAPVLVTRNNPLDFVTRKEMIQQLYPSVSVLSVPDHSSDVIWSQELDRRIREACPVGSVLMYGGRDGFIKSYHGHFPCVELPSHPDAVNGTEIRKELSREVKASPDFRAGVIFAAFNQYPKVYPTVDVAIKHGSEFLLGRKHGQNKFRFIGGFSDPEDSCFEEAATREAKEETGLDVEVIRYLGSSRIDDWRYRSERDKIMTLFFLAEASERGGVATDDIEEVRWFQPRELTEESMVPEHIPLLQLLKQSL